MSLQADSDVSLYWIWTQRREGNVKTQTREGKDVKTHRECHVKMDIKVGMTHLQAKDHQGLLEIPEAKIKTWN